MSDKAAVAFKQVKLYQPLEDGGTRYWVTWIESKSAAVGKRLKKEWIVLEVYHNWLMEAAVAKNGDKLFRISWNGRTA